MYTFVLYAIVIVVAILVEDIESVFNIVGAVCSTSIGVILPALFYFRQVDKKGKERTWKYYLSLSLFVVMIPYALFSIVASHV